MTFFGRTASCASENGIRNVWRSFEGMDTVPSLFDRAPMESNPTSPTFERERPRLCAIVITKNEEQNIQGCLESVRWADEIVVVDAESVDRTVQTARRYTDKVFVRSWPGFGPQKNFAMDQTTAEWILVVDADERVTDTLQQEIRRVLQAGPASDVAGFEIPRRNFFYGRWIRGGRGAVGIVGASTGTGGRAGLAGLGRGPAVGRPRGALRRPVHDRGGVRLRRPVLRDGAAVDRADLGRGPDGAADDGAVGCRRLRPG